MEEGFGFKEEVEKRDRERAIFLPCVRSYESMRDKEMIYIIERGKERVRYILNRWMTLDGPDYFMRRYEHQNMRGSESGTSGVALAGISFLISNTRSS